MNSIYFPEYNRRRFVFQNRRTWWLKLFGTYNNPLYLIHLKCRTNRIPNLKNRPGRCKITWLARYRTINVKTRLVWYVFTEAILDIQSELWNINKCSHQPEIKFVGIVIGQNVCLAIEMLAAWSVKMTVVFSVFAVSIMWRIFRTTQIKPANSNSIG